MGPSVQCYIFRCDPVRKELQLLLHHTNGSWMPPKAPLQGIDPSNQAGVEQYGLSYLKLSSGHENIPLEQLAPVPGNQHYTVFKQQSKLHLMVPPTAPWTENPGWTPQPSPQTVAGNNPFQHVWAGPGHDQLVVAGEPQQPSMGHAWVDLGALQADPNLCKDVTMWFRFEFPTVVPSIQTWFQMAKGNLDTTMATIRQRAGAGASPSSPSQAAPQLQPAGWASTGPGQGCVQNLHNICTAMAQMDAQTFTSAVDSCFQPSELHAIFARWQGKGMPLPCTLQQCGSG